ncbi:glycosyltransferase [Gillisia sp. Hel_I_29]|uniref:glycosyltransferase n=1 Tax=Gillisia sp. Hel_I_29 TaxID=1249975 RepID=UPI00055954FF|nr:glycosyltransferase [Gillisia sp. Hel_I_29]
MKILMVSMFSNHFFNWTKQLECQGHTIYWLDVYDANIEVEKISFVHHIIGWRNKTDYPGRYTIKKELPKLYDFINKFNQNKLADIFEKKMIEIQPDLVQSFEMFSSCVPILEVMRKYPKTKWVYNIWGNDLFYFKEFPKQKAQIKEVLKRINYLFSDCERDHEIAMELGFNREFLGVFPTGGGYDLDKYEKFLKVASERKTILIKGYEHEFGRCIKVLEAITTMKSELSGYNIVVFGANEKVEVFCKENNLDDWDNLIIYKQRAHSEILKLMGGSLIYVGNSVSDGMPNTLLEAIIMGVFPIQSNPGGATSEMITHGVNGFLINDAEDSSEIKSLIAQALKDPNLLKSGVDYNLENIKPKLERRFIANQVNQKYQYLQQAL